MSELEKLLVTALVGLLATTVGALIYVVKRKNGKANGTPTVAQLALVSGIKEHIDALERRLMEELKDTRHRVANGMQSMTAELLLALKERRGR